VIKYFVRHPTAANLLMLAMILIGLKALPDIKRETFPEFKSNFIQASIVLPGAGPEDVEDNLCRRMEDAVDGLGNIEEVRCEAIEGMGTLTLKLTSEADVGRMLVDVQTQIQTIKDLPPEAESAKVKELEMFDQVLDIALAANLPPAELKAYAQDFKDRLKLEADIKLITIKGFADHEMRVELELKAIRQLGLSVNDIARKVQSQNIRLPVGNIDTTEKNVLIRFDQQEITPIGLANMVIASKPDGSIVRLGNVATITDRFKLDEEKSRFNGKPTAVLSIQKNKSEDALRVKERIVQFMEKERKLLPAGVEMTITNDMSSLLSDRLNMLLKNGYQGIILVFLTMWVFFGFRYSFWVALGLPVAFFAALAFMPMFGLSINIMTLVAFLMAIGIMMDDAIVIAESIAAHIERGIPRQKAIIQGVSKVLPGVVSSYLTTVFIFSSLLFLDGQMGNVLKVVPMTLLLILTVSLFEAFWILPNHLNHSLKKGEEKPSKFRQAFNLRFETFRKTTLINAVDKAVQYRYLFLGSLVALFLASIALLAGGAVKFIGFPELDGDIVEARIIMPPGTPLSQTEQVVAHLIASAQVVNEEFSAQEDGQQPYVKDVTEMFNYNRDATEKGPHLATVRLDLLSAEIREGSLHKFTRRWREATGELAEPVSLVFKQPEMGPAGRAIEIRMTHPDLYKLKAAAVDVQHYLATFQGVYGLLDTMRPGKEEIKIRLLDGAEVYGIDGEQLANQLRGAYFYQQADRIQVGPESIEINVMLAKEDAEKTENLLNFPVRIGDHFVPLSSIASLERTRGFVRIARLDGRRWISVYGDIDVDQANANEIIQAFKDERMKQLLEDHPGLRIDFEGQTKESAKTGQSMMSGFILGLFGVFAILSFQFRSYLEPVTVMSAIPLALIGVIWGHFLLGYEMSMPSIMGFVSLAGIVVNDSILLVQYIRHHVEEGDSVHDAVVKASSERFRAVFITSVTTAAGLLPLLLETSLQAQILQPLVISVVFGIFASTTLVLFMVPTFYAVLDDFGKVSFANKAKKVPMD